MSSAIAPPTDAGSISGAAKCGPRTGGGGGGGTNLAGDLSACAVPRPDNNSSDTASDLYIMSPHSSVKISIQKHAVRDPTLRGTKAMRAL
jgi:hypothetical protein